MRFWRKWEKGIFSKVKSEILRRYIKVRFCLGRKSVVSETLKKWVFLKAIKVNFGEVKNWVFWEIEEENVPWNWTIPSKVILVESFDCTSQLRGITECCFVKNRTLCFRSWTTRHCREFGKKKQHRRRNVAADRDGVQFGTVHAKGARRAYIPVPGVFRPLQRAPSMGHQGRTP